MTQANNTSDSTEIQMTVEKQWKTYGGEGPDHHARVTVTDGEHEATFNLRNVFDFGFQVLAHDTVVYPDVDEWMDVRVKVQSTWDEDQDSIRQKGVVKDVEGMDESEIEFVNWEKADLPQLEVGQEYLLEGVVVNEFNDKKYLSLNSATDVSEVTDEYAEFEKQAREYVRENSPIPTGIRM